MNSSLQFRENYPEWMYALLKHKILPASTTEHFLLSLPAEAGAIEFILNNPEK